MPKAVPQVQPSLPAFFDSCDSSQQGPATTSSSSGDSNGQGPSGSSKNHNGLSFTCKWNGCHETFSDDPMSWWDHLFVHVPDNLSGPCKWEGCEASGGTRSSRFQSKFMFHHIQQHMPKKSFKCLMHNCNKRFDTPESLGNHIVKHPQPKKNDRSDYCLDDKQMKKIREIPCQSTDFLALPKGPGSLPSVQKDLKFQEVLSSIGISYLAAYQEYFISVHGVPEGDVTAVASGYQQHYRLHFPFKPQWILPLKTACTLNVSISPDAILVWKVPLSSSVFKEELRFFVNDFVQRMQKDSDLLF